jgi:hypothetical protein
MAYDYVTLDVPPVDLHNIAAGVVMAAEWEGLTGIPVIRGDVFDRSETDGVVEPTSQYLDARMIRGVISVWGTTLAAAWDASTLLNRTLLAAVRAQKLLKFRPMGHGSADLQTLVRLVSASYPVLKANDLGPFYQTELVFRAADPFNYSQSSQSASIGAPSTVSTGMPLPIVFPIPFGLVSTGGSVPITPGGNAPVYPSVTITGPIISPVIANVTKNQSLFFEGLTLASGEQLVVEFNPATPQSAKVAGVSKLGSLRYADSRFWTLDPGVAQTVSFYGLGLGYSGVTNMVVSWRDAYVT